MTTQHTPGPWRVAYGTRIEYGPIVAGEGFAVAKVLRDPAEWQANAHLIASSPQLLEAANDMLANIQRLRTCPKCKERECDCWEGAAKAIAAATGGPSAP